MEYTAGDMAQLCTLLPSWILNSEVQAVILVGLTCVGAWVIFTWIIQMIFSVLWPFFAVVLVMILVPSWRKFFTKDVVPKYLDTMRTLGQKITHGFNTTTHHN